MIKKLYTYYMEEVVLINQDPNIRVPSFGEWLDEMEDQCVINLEEDLDIYVKFNPPIKPWRCAKKVSRKYYYNPTINWEFPLNFVEVHAVPVKIKGMEYLDTYLLAPHFAEQFLLHPNTIIEGRMGIPLLNSGGDELEKVIHEIKDLNAGSGFSFIERQIMFHVSSHSLSPRYSWIEMGGSSTSTKNEKHA
jgi:hypothetical protein